MFRKFKRKLKCILIGADADEFLIHREKSIKTKIWLLKIYHKYCCSKILYNNNAAIHDETKILGKIIFPHGLNGILISQRAVIGKNCIIFQQVTIGSNTLRDTNKAGAPILGDNVYIGAGAKIIGGIKIGNNVRIGANCVVVDDIPDNCTVVMNKPKIVIHDKYKDNKFDSWAVFKKSENNIGHNTP